MSFRQIKYNILLFQCSFYYQSPYLRVDILKPYFDIECYFQFFNKEQGKE